jgi:hypothetical protein
LWTISKADAYVIYKNIFQNLLATVDILYVVYYFAGKYTGDAHYALDELEAKLVHKERYPSLFFGAKDEMFVYKLQKQAASN